MLKGGFVVQRQRGEVQDLHACVLCEREGWEMAENGLPKTEMHFDAI
jgi:hypothetical protein